MKNQKNILSIPILILCALLFMSVTHLKVNAATAPSNTYKIIYHYSLQNKTKQVVKTIKVGSTPKLLSEKDTKFTHKTQVFVGWNGYVKKWKKWKLCSGIGNVSRWGSYTAGDLYTFPAGYIVKEKIKAGDEFHLYGQWLNPSNIPVTTKCFHVRGYVANGKDTVDDTLALQTALNFAKTTEKPLTFTIPNGTYYINNSLLVYSNTKLILSSNAKIIRNNNFKADAPMLYVGQKGAPNERAQGYDQAKNIVIKGGIWDANAKNTNYNEGCVMRFNHCKDITLKGCTIQNYSSKHGVVFAGVKRGIVQDCTFQNQQFSESCKWYAGNPKTLQNAEAIHTDIVNHEGEPDAYPIDNTICENIVIKNNTFTNVFTGVGNHVDTFGKYSQSYKITNNDFSGVLYYGINAYCRKNMEITNNKAKDFSTLLRDFESTYKINPEFNNIFKY